MQVDVVEESRVADLQYTLCSEVAHNLATSYDVVSMTSQCIPVEFVYANAIARSSNLRIKKKGCHFGASFRATVHRRVLSLENNEGNF